MLPKYPNLQLFCKLFAVLLLFYVFIIPAGAQTRLIKGKVTDVATGEAIPYATVAIRGTSIGTHTDFDGLYNLEFVSKKDSITFNCIGYAPKTVFIGSLTWQVINLALQPLNNTLDEVRITPKGYINPAWPIINQVIKRKPVNDPRQLASYQYHSYNRIEFDANDLSAKLLSKRGFKKLVDKADSLGLSGISHSTVLPLFESESISDFYYKANPATKHENIIHTRTRGVGFEDGTLMAQLTGSTFQQYNFYKNFLTAAGKDFASPISENCYNWYEYDLQNRNAVVGGKACFQIAFAPKNPKDLAFTGVMWIAKDNYALYQVKATIEPTANLNFINLITIQQLMDGVNGRAWLPAKTRILVEVKRVSENTSGLLAKFYTVNTNVEINKTYPDNFFAEPLTIAPNVDKTTNQYWDINRPDTLSKAEKGVYNLIGEVKDLPAVKNYITVADLLINGYYRVGKVGFGPFIESYSYNNVEGNRLRVGFKTNNSFDKNLILGGFLAYGTRDNAVKYGANADYILTRKNWTEAGISFKHDLNQVALLSENYIYQRDNLFGAFTGFGKISRRKVFFQDDLELYIKRDLFKGFTEKVTFANWTLDPLFPFNFKSPNGTKVGHYLFVSEFQFESKWSPGVMPLISESSNKQLKVKSNVEEPVITFRYTLGLKDFLSGSNAYNKFSINIAQTLKMGRLGRGKYSFSAGFIPSTVPYPLLENHLGNQTFLYNPNAFNQMRFFEFASDKYASLNYTQHFEGLLLNEVPIIKNFNWRLVGTANILFGGISKTNQNDISIYNQIKLHSFGSTPYMETGAGIENIFKFLRVDCIRRLTYLQNRDSYNNLPQKFGVKISAQIRL